MLPGPKAPPDGTLDSGLLLNLCCSQTQAGTCSVPGAERADLGFNREEAPQAPGPEGQCICVPRNKWSRARQLTPEDVPSPSSEATVRTHGLEGSPQAPGAGPFLPLWLWGPWGPWARVCIPSLSSVATQPLGVRLLSKAGPLLTETGAAVRAPGPPLVWRPVTQPRLQRSLSNKVTVAGSGTGSSPARPGAASQSRVWASR